MSVFPLPLKCHYTLFLLHSLLGFVHGDRYGNVLLSGDLLIMAPVLWQLLCRCLVICSFVGTSKTRVTHNSSWTNVMIWLVVWILCIPKALISTATRILWHWKGILYSREVGKTVVNPTEGKAGSCHAHEELKMWSWMGISPLLAMHCTYEFFSKAFDVFFLCARYS